MTNNATLRRKTAQNQRIDREIVKAVMEIAHTIQSTSDRNELCEKVNQYAEMFKEKSKGKFADKSTKDRTDAFFVLLKSFLFELTVPY